MFEPEIIKFEYKTPRELAPNLWEIQGDWTNKFGRRMTVVRLTDGRVFVHNAFRLRQKDLKWLKSLGSVVAVLAPNAFHTSDAGWMKNQFPYSDLYVPQAKIKSFKQLGFDCKNINKDFPPEFQDELKCIPSQGTRFEEAVFIHVPSKTLILCDMAFNMGNVYSGFEKWLMSLNRVGNRFGPSKLMKIAFTKNTNQVKATFKEILRHDFDRVIVNHGDVLETNGKIKLKTSVEEIFGPL